MPPREVEEMNRVEMVKYRVWLETQKPIPPGIEQAVDGIYATCGRCGKRLGVLLGVDAEQNVLMNVWRRVKFCPACGQRVKRWEGDGEGGTVRSVE